MILGIVLGGLTVLFALQNTEFVTVSFLTSDITAPLSFVLLGTMLGGIAVMLLSLLPFVIRDEFATRRLRRDKKALEEELARMRAGYSDPTQPVEAQTII